MPVIFEYEPKNTIIHRLNPISKVVMLVCFFILISIYWDIKYLSIMFLLALILYVVSKTPKKWILLAIPFGTYRFIEAAIYGMTLADPKYYKVIPPDVAGKVLIQFGPIVLVYGGFVWALAQVLKIVIVMMLTFMFIYTIPYNELIKSLTILKVPYKIIYILIIALRFVPDIWREFLQTSMAQSLRGWKIRTRNPIKLAKMSGPIVNPFTRRLIDYVDRIALTVQIRGFGTKKAQYPWRLELKLADWITIVLSMVFLAIALYAHISYQIGLI